MAKDKSTKDKKDRTTPKEIKESPKPSTTPFRLADWFSFEYIAVYLLILLVICLIFFQYKYEKNERDSTGIEDTEVNYYEVLDVDPSADLSTIRKKYKNLAKIWHPDKHLDCKICKEKFGLITKAYEVLTDEAKKGDYDHRSGKSIFSSEPVILTEVNYHRLVEESADFWVICVYENRPKDRYLQSFVDVFDEVALKFRNIIKFGVIDALRYEGLLKYLPYNFPIMPTVYTFQHGEDSELFQNIEDYGVKTLIQFIEDSYVTKVNLADSTFIQKLANTGTGIVEIPPMTKLELADLDVKLLIISSRHFIDIVVKDFAQTYRNSVQVYQNYFNDFDKVMKIIGNSKSNHRVYISYNNLYNMNSGTLARTFKPIPVVFKLSSNAQKKYQISFNLVKSLMAPKIYRSNYLKHCITKIHLEGEEIEEEVDNTKIAICVIMIDGGDSNLSKGVYLNMLNNFNKNYNSLTKAKKRKDEDSYKIEINYGTASLEGNEELKAFYKRYLTEREIEQKEGKLFLIINHTNEKFVFKTFQEAGPMLDYFSHLDNSEDFEDFSLGFDYFADYQIKDIAKLFPEEKIFSIVKIFTMTWYSQTKMFILLSIVLTLCLFYKFFDKYSISQFNLVYAYCGIILFLFSVNLFNSLFQ